MADEPTPPPTEEESEDEQELYPFLDAGASGGADLQIRAGMAEVESGSPVQPLVVNYQGSAGSPAALKAYETALEWYRDVVSALMQQE